MDWRDTPEQAEWRKEVRSFLKTELPDFGELDRYSRPGAGEMKAAWDKWRSALASRGWIASAQIEEHLIRRFGDRWFLKRAAAVQTEDAES